MDVTIKPSVLEFKAPFTVTSTETIFITNNSSETIAFKVKTTAPKLYCVRPNAATVEPGQTTEVSIIFLGLKTEPEAGYECKDKFLIVVLPCPHELGDQSVSEVWPKLDAEYKQQSISKKIKVNFKLNSATAVPVGISSGVATGSAATESKITESAKSTDGVSEEDRSKIDELNEKLDSNVAESSAVSEKKAAAASGKQVAQPSSLPITTIILLAIIAFIIAWLFF